MTILEYSITNDGSIDEIILLLRKRFKLKNLRQELILSTEMIEFLDTAYGKSNSSLVFKMENSFIGDEIVNLSKEMGEFTLDVFLENDLVKSIPVFNILHSITKIGLNIREKAFAKKVYKFLIELNKVTSKERKEFLDKIEKDEKYETKVGEQMVILLERVDDFHKASILGRLMCAVVKGNLDYDNFLRLAFSLGKIHSIDINLLKRLDKREQLKSHEIESLTGTGLTKMQAKNKKVLIPDSDTNRFKTEPVLEYKVNELGKLLIKYGLSKEEIEKL